MSMMIFNMQSSALESSDLFLQEYIYFLKIRYVLPSATAGARQQNSGHIEITCPKRSLASSLCYFSLNKLCAWYILVFDLHIYMYIHSEDLIVQQDRLVPQAQRRAPEPQPLVSFFSSKVCVDTHLQAYFCAQTPNLPLKML